MAAVWVSDPELFGDRGAATSWGYCLAMFTGLVQQIGTVQAIGPLKSGSGKGGVKVGGAGQSIRLELDAGSWAYRPAAGDSVSVSGCCLTVVESPTKRRPQLLFDVVQETLDKTSLGRLTRGSKVNLEHAATPTTLMGGHMVQGHVDGVGRIARVQDGEDWRVFVELPKVKGKDKGATRHVSDENLGQYIVPKGSICVDGTSLTVAGLWSGKPEADRKVSTNPRMSRGFWVALIPTTLAKTTLAELSVGDPVNLEVDIISKTCVFWLRQYAGAQR